MPLYEALILGLIQGVTEFLPISSSGHLIFLPEVLKWQDHTLLFDTTVHLGTSLALLIYFWKDLLAVLKDIKGIGLKLFIGMLPAGILGFLFDDLFETYFRDLNYVILFLFSGSVLMLIAERYRSNGTSMEELSLKKSGLIGLFQSLALFPGFSRSGSTISGGMLSGLSREAAARFSFLLSIPLVWAATALKWSEVSFSALTMKTVAPLLVGGLTSFVSGFLCIKFLMKFLKNNNLYPFIVYRFVLVIVLLVILLV